MREIRLSGCVSSKGIRDRLSDPCYRLGNNRLALALVGRAFLASAGLLPLGHGSGPIRLLVSYF